MILTKSTIPPHDPAVPAPWLAPVPRFLHRFSPLSPCNLFFPAHWSGPGPFNGLHRESHFLAFKTATQTTIRWTRKVLFATSARAVRRVVAAAALFQGSQAPAAALISHWALDETSGTMAADSAGSYKGTIGSAATLNQTGQLGTACGFVNNNASYVSVGTIPWTPTQTISAWVNSTDTSGAGDNILGWSGNEYVQFRMANGRLNYRAAAGNFNADITSSASIANGHWHHVAATLTNGALQLYVDGTADGAGNASGTWTSTSGVWIGGLSAFPGIYQFVGSIDDLARWDGALDGAKVRALYNLGANSILQYDAANATMLFDVFDGTRSGASIGDLKWSKVADGTLSGVAGQVVSLSDGNFGLTLNATGGGVRSVAAGPPKNITSLVFPGLGPATILGTTIRIEAPNGTDLTVLKPAYTLSAGATCVPASGSTQDFSHPVDYLVTASDGTTRDFTVTVFLPRQDPVFTLTAPATWDGRQAITVTPDISNWSALQASGATNLNYTWSVAKLSVSKQVGPATLTLLRSQGSGPLAVTLTLDNGGVPVTQTTTIRVQEPSFDAWVQRTPAVDEKPVNNQFIARDDSGFGAIHYNGNLAGTPESVFLKVYAKPETGTETLASTLRQTLSNGRYAFTSPITAGLVTYRVEFGTTSGGIDTVNPAATVTNLVCGDAYVIEGQSNAVANNYNGDTSNPAFTYYTSPWIRSYGTGEGGTSGAWGNAVVSSASGDAYRIGYWGMALARNLVERYSMPICIINGAVGGTRIDQHQPNPEDHWSAGSSYSIYANLLARVGAAKLTHGIRAVLWHQGESDQWMNGPTGYWATYQQLFVEMSNAWKQDFPNLRHYYIFQIWPSACSAVPADDPLREVQRTLPYLYSNMRIMSSLGVVPGGSACHYNVAGYQQFAALMSPLVEQDNYGLVPGQVITAPDVKRVYYTSTARTEIALEFGQNMAWHNASKGLFYLDGVAGKVTSGSVSGNVIKLQLTAASTSRTLTYLVGSSWDGVQGNLLYGANGIAALTFYQVPIAADPFAAWITGSGFSFPAGADLSATGDPDHDGITNQQEFAFGLDPATASSLSPLTTNLSAAGQFSYTRLANSGLAYTVEYSTDLSSWNPATATESPGPPDDKGVQTVTVTVVNPAQNGKLFVRVKAR